MIDTIKYNGKTYPAFQASGNASRFIIPFAKEVCKGKGLDIGFSKIEWKLPGAIGIEPSIDFTYDAMNLPEGEFDYIFSSHMLEHYKGNFANLLDYWTTKIKPGGVLFLYLPDYSQYYWRVWNNRKHIHSLSPQILKDYLEQSGQYTNIFVSGIDLNNSFAVMAEKTDGVLGSYKDDDKRKFISVGEYLMAEKMLLPTSVPYRPDIIGNIKTQRAI